MIDIGRLSIHEVTLRGCPIPEERLQIIADAGISGLSLMSRTIEQLGVARIRTLFADLGLQVYGVGGGGWFDAPNPSSAMAANRRLIEAAHDVGAKHLSVVVGGLLRGSKSIDVARGRTLDLLDRLLDDAADAGIILALEPLHPMFAADRSWLVSLSEAHAICERLDPDNARGARLLVDAYHVWWEPSLAQLISETAGRIACVHICDWRTPTTALSDQRSMMGDGAIDLRGFLAALDQADYRGPHEVEIMSDEWWSRDPALVAAICRERYLSLA